jgi:beta-barrel assembly-enhancing protease
MQHEIATIFPEKPQYVVDTSEFQEVKARLARLDNLRGAATGKDKGPSPRRDSTSQGDHTNPDSTAKIDGGRPTLNWRDDQ